jgi:hypothetical protein
MIIFLICNMLTTPFPKTTALKDAAEKSADLLAVRTERFVEFRVRKEDELKPEPSQGYCCWRSNMGLLFQRLLLRSTGWSGII